MALSLANAAADMSPINGGDSTRTTGAKIGRTRSNKRRSLEGGVVILALVTLSVLLEAAVVVEATDLEGFFRCLGCCFPDPISFDC